MNRSPTRKAPPRRLREPVQVSQDSPDQDRLARLREQLEASKSEVLRRGLEALERGTLDSSRHPAHRIIGIAAEAAPGAEPGYDVAREHDRFLAETEGGSWIPVENRGRARTPGGGGEENGSEGRGEGGEGRAPWALTCSWIPAPGTLWPIPQNPDHAGLAASLRARLHAVARVVNTNLVVAETHALLPRRAGREVALRFLREVRRDPLVVESSTPELELRAPEEWLAAFQDQDCSLADTVSFAVMRGRGIREALTLDRHFAVAGFGMVGVGEP